jgi:hypothetical protein
LLESKVVALRLNQSAAFKFLYQNFQSKLINFYSNCQRFFKFLKCYLGTWSWVLWSGFCLDCSLRDYWSFKEMLSKTNPQFLCNIPMQIKFCLKIFSMLINSFIHLHFSGAKFWKFALQKHINIDRISHRNPILKNCLHKKPWYGSGVNCLFCQYK